MSTMHRSDAGYRPLRDKQEEMPAFGRRFFVILTGKTNDAHKGFLTKFLSAGHVQVNSVQDCDYCLVFCPVTTRVGTDIDEALENIPSDKPVILLVMHHTFDRNHVVVDSSRLVTRPNVQLTVDCLFYERNLLSCSHNDMAWYQIKKCLGIVEISPFNNWKMIIGVGAVAATAIVIIAVLVWKLT